mmetsp:Transcript_55388/g.140794  ORF Transcript_55388/g.140794 Transcript_55388/m.140794 type:complete len:202 (+) Transcript_55388:65-670(+)
MPYQGAVILCLLLAAASASNDDPSITACSCNGGECRCEPTSSTESENTQQALEQTKQFSQWWGQHMAKVGNVTCSCSGTACYCSRAPGRGDEAHLEHSSCLCTNSSGEACHCGHSNPTTTQPQDMSKASEDEAELMGETKEMSEAVSQKFWPYHPYRPYHPYHPYHPYYPGGCHYRTVCHSICHWGRCYHVCHHVRVCHYR